MSGRSKDRITIKLPAPVSLALEHLHTDGYDAYVVGGCVRDALLSKEPGDWDITTDAHPTDICRVFNDMPVIPTGLQHGTVTVLINGMPLEITTYRIDGQYTDGRHPDDVRFTLRLSEDLHRRDFTVNAMAYNEQAGLIDLFDGRADLTRAIIRCVGDPATRFTEDSLRILRALRFSSVLGFTIEADTGAAARQLSHALSRVSVERIATELRKCLCGAHASTVLRDFWNVFAVVIPELDYAPKQVDTISVAMSTASPTLPVRLALLFALCTDPARVSEAALTRLHFDRHTITTTKIVLDNWNMELPSDAALCRLIGKIGYDNARILCDVRSALIGESLQVRVDRLQSARACCAVSDLVISGDDLVSAGYTPGPQLGEELHRLLDAVIDGDVPNKREELLVLAATHYAKYKK